MKNERRGGVRVRGKNELERAGWKETRAGRWIEPGTGRSFNSREAWNQVHDAMMAKRMQEAPSAEAVDE